MKHLDEYTQTRTRTPSVLVGNKLVYLEEDGSYIAYPLSTRRKSRKANQLLGADIHTNEYGWKITQKRDGIRSLSTLFKPTHFQLSIHDSEDRQTELYLTPEQVLFLKESIDSWEEYRSLFD